MFNTVLIANRGEIAVRVARTCRELGIRTVAAYSSADCDSEALRLCDGRVKIGPPAARHSYLNLFAVMSAAEQVGADAIHPGYGFLSEDPDLAEVCADNDIVLIGPPPSVLAELGDKARARTLMAKAGLPVLPGSDGVVHGPAEAERIADEVGYPLMIKAAAGGGGQGMAVVHEPEHLLDSYRSVKAHARSVFGDSRVYIERYVADARHVEVQVLCDRFGNAVHLGERDCSVQRRHQKLVEETPAPGIDPTVTACMSELAVSAAQAIGYVGLGTFEFLVDGAGAFTFMEINCRIQVEHPVTEMVTGVDLVREQITLAAGQPLSFRQVDVARRGVALESRVNTEDPRQGFTPAPGVLTEFRLPGGPFTRVDTHGYPGWTVPPYYDSLLAKVVVWAPDRPQALARMDRALDEFSISGPGVHTTIGFVRDVLADPRFRTGRHTTALVDQMLTPVSRSRARRQEHGN